MTEHQTLSSFLAEYSGKDTTRKAVADTLNCLANSFCAISEIIELGPLAVLRGYTQNQKTDGDLQVELDVSAKEIVIE